MPNAVIWPLFRMLNLPSPKQQMPDSRATDVAFLRKATEESRRSHDPKSIHVSESGVGCIIVKDKAIVARSANVLPPSLRRSSQPDDHRNHVSNSDRYFFIEHAERAAIFAAYLDGVNLNGATMYCTRFPCADCARAISWTQISRVVLSSGMPEEGRWFESQAAAMRILTTSKIEVDIFPLQD